ncbi:MAG: dihydrodipicolinate synthase family protein [Deltaproteobacteria bacterium]|nr:dihydrodipicolinate synthase family protein [Deltaproteobacteria bacterium]
MAELNPPKGLIVDLITPLTKRRDIDEVSLTRHLKRVIPHVHALLLGSPLIGEGRYLGPVLREQLLEKTLSIVEGHMPVFIWITQDSEGETRMTLIRLRKRLEIRKYTGQVFFVDAPLYYHSNRGLPELYQDMISSIEDSVILYNDPQLIKHIGSPFKRNNIRTSVLRELILNEKIQGLVFSGSLDRAHNYQKAVSSRPDFRIYDGDESRFLIHPSLGGVVSAGANLAPEAWQKITGASLRMNGRQSDYPDYLKQIWEIGGYLSRLREIYQTHGAVVIKMILAEKGIIDHTTCMEEEGGLDVRPDELKELVQQYKNYH